MVWSCCEEITHNANKEVSKYADGVRFRQRVIILENWIMVMREDLEDLGKNDDL